MSIYWSGEHAINFSSCGILATNCLHWLAQEHMCTALLLQHTHLWWFTWSQSGMKTRLQTCWRAASSPHQLIMVTIIGVINWLNYRPITEALLSDGENGGLLLRCPASVHHFGLDPCAPWTPQLSSPPLIPSCLHYLDAEVTLCKGQGLGVVLSLRRAPKIGAVWFLTTEEPGVTIQWRGELCVHVINLF